MQNRTTLSPFTSGNTEPHDIPRLEDAVTFTDDEVYNWCKQPASIKGLPVIDLTVKDECHE